MDQATLLWGLLFGSIGCAYFLYGKKQSRPVPLFSGISLMIYPYMVGHSVLLLVGVGLVLSALPFFLQL